MGDALAGDADRDLVEMLGEFDADLACQEADLRRRRGRLAQLLQQAETGGKLSGRRLSLPSWLGCSTAWPASPGKRRGRSRRRRRRIAT